MNIVVNRENKEKEVIESSRFVKFLYNTFFGRVLLKNLIKPWFTNFCGKYMNSVLSKPLMNKTIKKYHVDMKLFEDKKYNSYNSYFTRRLKEIKIDADKNHLISPCDCKLLSLTINEKNIVKIKNSYYKLDEIINDNIVKEYNDGYMLIFRLTEDNYHHYCYIDDGYRDKYHKILGEFHTVQPIAEENNYKVFHRNTREWTVLHTKNFGDIIQVEVGALLVGKIKNNDVEKFEKGEEKGYFEFGGSTIIFFIKKDQVLLDQDIIDNSSLGYETSVKYGMKIGQKL